MPRGNKQDKGSNNRGGKGSGKGAGRGRGGQEKGMGPCGNRTGQKNKGGEKKKMSSQKSQNQNKMVCITAVGPGLDEQLDPMFGRCQFFIIVNLGTGAFQTLPNTARNNGNGAGISAVQFVANKNTDTVVTGRVGPKAADAFKVAGISVITGANGTVREVVARYFNKNI